jgi:hypothetical protein
VSNYVKATNFAVKDSLVTGDPAKVVKGTEIDTEFNAIASAVASKADLQSPAFSGTPTAPTPTGTSNDTSIATTAYVQSAISGVGGGTVTSVAASGGTTGMTFTGSPITSTGTFTLAGKLNIANGGTGGTSAVEARSNLGLGTMAQQNFTNVNITGGSISGVSLSLPGNVVYTDNPQTITGAKTFTGAFTATQQTQSSYNFTANSSHFWTGSEVQTRISGSMVFFVAPSSAGFSISDVQKVGGGSFNSYSDSRYKQDVAPYQKGLTELKEINPVNYRYTAEFMHSASPSKQFTGLIAQDVQNTSFRNCVSTDSKGFLVLDTSELVFALINAVKELSAEVEALKANQQGAL